MVRQRQATGWEFIAAAVFALAVLAPSNVLGETKVGFRQLTNTFPVAVQRGQEAEVQVFTNFTLNDVRNVFFDRGDIAMRCLEEKPIAAPRKGRGSKGTPFRFHVETPADQATGVYEFRIATKQAVSSCGQLMVTDHPVVLEEKGDNQTAEGAQEIQFPAAICGRCEAFEDVDCFRFTGKAGQTLSLEIFAQRVTEKIHSMVVRGPRIYLMDPILTLTGPNGQVVAQNDNYYGGDSLIHCVLPADGDYVLEVRDARFAGDVRYSYCVEITDGPHLVQTFPMAVQQGASTNVQLVGNGLGEIASLPIEGDATVGWNRRSFETLAGRTNAIPVRTSPHPQTLEQEPNNTFAEATAVEVPCGANGRLANRDDTDFYRFTAQKDRFYHLRVEARDYGSAIDSVIEVYDAKGKLLVENDDRATPRSKDSELYWKAPADGEFAVAVRDLHDDGGPRYGYHLRIENSGPDFVLTGEYYYAMLAPGTQMMWFAKLQRLNGFDGPVEVKVEGLPQGVQQVPLTIPGGMNHGAIILTANADAKLDASLVTIKGSAKTKWAEEEVTLERRGHVTCEQQGSGGGQSRWPIATQIVAVTEPLDLLSVKATPAQVTLSPGKTCEIDVEIQRNEGFKDAVSLDMEFKYFANVLGSQLPPGVKMSAKSKARLVGDTLQGKIILEATDKALAVEELPIAVVARVSITFSITTNYASNPILLTVQPPESSED